MSHDILFVDDDEMEHRLFDAFLISLGLKGDVSVAFSMNLDQAISHLCQVRFDFIYLDNRILPFGSFEATLPNVKQHSADAEIILMSASLIGMDINMAKSLGADAILDKSFLQKDLASRFLHKKDQADET